MGVGPPSELGLYCPRTLSRSDLTETRARRGRTPLGRSFRSVVREPKEECRDSMWKVEWTGSGPFPSVGRLKVVPTSPRGKPERLQGKGKGRRSFYSSVEGQRPPSIDIKTRTVIVPEVTSRVGLRPPVSPRPPCLSSPTLTAPTLTTHYSPVPTLPTHLSLLVSNSLPVHLPPPFLGGDSCFLRDRRFFVRDRRPRVSTLPYVLESEEGGGGSRVLPLV